MSTLAAPVCPACGRTLDRVDHVGVEYLILDADVYRPVNVVDGDGGGIASGVDLRCGYCQVSIPREAREFFYPRWYHVLELQRETIGVESPNEEESPNDEDGPTNVHTFRCSDKVWRDAKRKAKRQRVSLSGVLAELLRFWVDADPEVTSALRDAIAERMKASAESKLKSKLT